MEKMLEKISSYNVANYIIPGVIFSVAISESTTINLPTKNGSLFENIVIYYFFGMIISRMGSIIIQTIFEKFNYLSFAPYPDYIRAEKKDKKISILLEEKNTYRTMVACFTMVFLVIAAACLCDEARKPAAYIYAAAAIFLVFLFCRAIKKQVSFIVKRVNIANETISEES